MEELIVKTSVRDELGKEACKKLRRKGFIPGIVYKGGKKGLSIYVDGKELWKAMHTEAGGNAIISLNISGSKKETGKTVIIQEVQQSPINDDIIHVDFHEISLTEKIRVKVPVIMKGEAPGVKEQEGVLTQGLWQIEVECLPREIPENISVNVDHLRIGDAIHVKDIKIEANYVILDDPDEVVASVSVQRAEEEPVAAEPVEGEVEPELIKKGKKEEEGEEAEGATETKEAAPEKAKQEKKPDKK